MTGTELTRLKARHEIVRVAYALYGTPYLYAGPSLKYLRGPVYFGLDCSGFAVEVLVSVGLLRAREDLSAAGLLGRFETSTVGIPAFGGLVFWMDGNVADHVCITVSEEVCIGALSGDPDVTSLEEAIRRDARVKVRPIDYRAGRRVYCDPLAKKEV